MPRGVGRRTRCLLNAHLWSISTSRSITIEWPFLLWKAEKEIITGTYELGVEDAMASLDLSLTVRCTLCPHNRFHGHS
jgi:hypothetical protein